MRWALGADVEATDDGAVYLFDAITGALVREIVNPTPESFDSFGRSVALSGDLVVIGADGDNTGTTRGLQVPAPRMFMR